MVAGLERYYQIARCFRDEDSRADRTPEFTQLDVEMSFPDEEDIYDLTEELLVALWSEVRGVEIPRPFPRLTYAEAVRRFGSDRPDLRFGLELVDLRELFAKTEVGVFKSVLGAGGHVGGVVMPGGSELTRKQLDGWIDWAKGRGAKGLAYVIVEPDGTLRSPLVKFFSEAEIASLAAASGAVPGDLVFLVAAPEREALELLGALRVAVAKDRNLIPEDEWRFLWVTDFPMFEPYGDNDEGWTAVHHPFTAPADADAATFQDQPGTALARAYDVVLNGSELGGGSIRIHRAEMQQRVFDTIGLTRDEAQSKFGFLLEAFQYGPPPHGGIALGLDRLAAVLAGTDAIREVMAFPKSSSGDDPLTGAPTPITPEQRKEAGIDVLPEAEG
jgi:aspartyl-tRNA synthetase